VVGKRGRRKDVATRDQNRPLGSRATLIMRCILLRSFQCAGPSLGPVRAVQLRCKLAHATPYSRLQGPDSKSPKLPK
jgi:hypothetical protein